MICWHREWIGVESYESFYGATLKDELVKQYEVEGLPGLLLSPRARRRGDKFDCCLSCFNSMRASNVESDSPPKHAIANGFVIGTIPKVITTINEDGSEDHTPLDKEEDLTDVFCSFLSSTRAFG